MGTRHAARLPALPANSRPPCRATACFGRGIRIAAIAGGGVTLWWAAVAGQRCRVQFKSQLNAPVWQELAVVTAALDTISFEVSPGNEVGQRFYRLVVD